MDRSVTRALRAYDDPAAYASRTNAERAAHSTWQKPGYRVLPFPGYSVRSVALTARERTAFRKQVISIIESCMKMAGWSCLPYRHAMRLFSREGDVTPVLLLSNIAGRGWGEYVIEGGIGILHRTFERRWSAGAGRAASAGGPTVIRHTANFRELSGLAYIDPHEPVETQVYPWCEVAVAILRAMPMTHEELSAAYREKRLVAGAPLRHYLLLQQDDKRAAFDQYLEGG
jgi:hypothetical protein